MIYLAEKKACRRFPRPASPDLFGGSPGVARNFQVFDALDFIAEITQHIPDTRKHLVRYFGFYSNKSRGMRAKAAGNASHEQQVTRSPSPTQPAAGGPPSSSVSGRSILFNVPRAVPR